MEALVSRRGQDLIVEWTRDSAFRFFPLVEDNDLGLTLHSFDLSIYVHEMGHVAALRRCGIAATAPMFVPGLGAFIRMRSSHFLRFTMPVWAWPVRCGVLARRSWRWPSDWRAAVRCGPP